VLSNADESLVDGVVSMFSVCLDLVVFLRQNVKQDYR
jgi:hypothetical protein